MKGSTTRNKLLPWASFALLIAAWQVLATLINSEILLPTPATTWGKIVAFSTTEIFWLSVLATLRRGLTGFALSLFIGVACGLGAGFSITANALMQPVVLASRSTPLMSIILLALIWFRADKVPIFVSFLVCFPIIFTNVFEGVKNVDHNLLEMARIYRVGLRSTITDIYLPAIIPYLLAGSSTALGLGLKVVIAAEALSQPQMAIGTRMQVERLYLETAGVFAWTIAALAISWFLELTVRWIGSRLTKGVGSA